MANRVVWLRRGLAALWLSVVVSLMAALPAGATMHLAEAGSDDSGPSLLLLLVLGPIAYGVIYMIYRNPAARHKYESETDVKIDHLEQVDQLIEQRKKTRDAQLPGANSTQLRGNRLSGKTGKIQDFLSKATRT